MTCGRRDKRQRSPKVNENIDKRIPLALSVVAYNQLDLMREPSPILVEAYEAMASLVAEYGRPGDEEYGFRSEVSAVLRAASGYIDSFEASTQEDSLWKKILKHKVLGI